MASWIDWLKNLMAHNTLVVLAAVSLLGACAGVVGCFAVLRRRSLTGDMLAHASLPGLCLAFWIVGEPHLPFMLAGALVTGILGLGVISFLLAKTRIKEDAALGIVLGVFFGGGIVLSSLLQRAVAGSKAGFESFIFGKTAGILQQDVYWILGLTLLCLGLIIRFNKEFLLVTFDAPFGRVQGLPMGFLDFLLLLLIAVVVVVGLPVVGVVLIAALLILPGASARFWTQRLRPMLIWSGTFGWLMGASGTMLSAQLEKMPAGPTIILIGSGIFLVSLFLGPCRGLLAWHRTHRQFKKDLQSGNVALPNFDEPPQIIRGGS